MQLDQFGSEEYPIRSSQLPLLMSCPWRSVMLWFGEMQDTVHTAADTGSAVHKAAETLHRHSKTYDECMDAAKTEQDKYPKVDWDEVRLFFRPYYEDPRNHGVRFIAIEEHFKITFPNPKGAKEIVVMGTFDQVRECVDEGGNKFNMLYDIKTGSSMDAFDTLAHHTLQLACYWLGAKHCNLQVDKVGIIYVSNYRKRGAVKPSPTGIFLEHTLQSLDACRILMEGVFNRVNMIRRGEIDVVPGYACNKCPARSTSVCLPIYTQRGF